MTSTPTLPPEWIVDADGADPDAVLAEAWRIAITASAETPENGLVLFSISYQPTSVNRDRALAFIAEDPVGRMTIEQTEVGVLLGRLPLYAPSLGIPYSAAVAPWRLASYRITMAARGVVTTFANGADPRSTFVQVELPTLERAPHVSLVVER